MSDDSPVTGRDTSSWPGNDSEGRYPAATREESIEMVRQVDVTPVGDLSASDITDLQLDSDRTFWSSHSDNRESLSIYRTAAREDRIGSLRFDPGENVAGFVAALDVLPTDDVAALLEGGFGEDATTADRLAEERETRRETRQAGREAAEAAGVDLEEFDVGATAGGEVILQDEDTGRTRTIDADTSGGLGAALDAETSGGEFVTDAADPAAGPTSDDGLGARVVAAIVLLLGAIAAAVRWSA